MSTVLLADLESTWTGKDGGMRNRKMLGKIYQRRRLVCVILKFPVKVILLFKAEACQLSAKKKR